MLTTLLSLPLATIHIWTAIAVFALIVFSMIFEKIDKGLVVLLGVTILLFTGTISHETVLEHVNFTTIILLMALMIMVSVIEQSKILEWLNAQTVKATRGNPLMLFIVFCGLTLVLSTFLANSTTMLILVPLTIVVTKNMNISAKPYIIGEIIFSVVGGTYTIIGDPVNVLISAAADIGFTEFTQFMFIPLTCIALMYMTILIAIYWKSIKPITRSITKLLTSNMLIARLEMQFTRNALQLPFALTTISVFMLTIIAMILNLGNMPIEYIAIAGAAIVLFTTYSYNDIDKVYKAIDVHTLLFFAGLFVSVGALEETGALQYVSDFILTHAQTTFGVAMLTLWVVGLLSAFIENIPLVAMMIPVVESAIGSGTLTGNTQILWYALSLGACLGGNGSLLGSSANILGAQLAKKNGVHISFKEYFVIGYPLTLLSLVISSIVIYLHS
jgi:Na+/H+ antiporter NhaD/arsenite permease-like protein